MGWNWRQFWKRAIRGGLTIGLIVGLIVGLGGLIVGLISGGFGLIIGLIVGLSFGSSVVLIGGLVSGLLGGLVDTDKTDKASPNEGIKLSAKNATISFLFSILCFGLLLGPSVVLVVLSEGLSEGLNVVLSYGLSYGLIIGLIVGLNRGGSAVAKHYSLRLILWLKGYTPFRFIGLLDHCAKLILLKKVGGGYMFIHRMLLEYFVALNTKTPDSGNLPAPHPGGDGWGNGDSHKYSEQITDRSE